MTEPRSHARFEIFIAILLGAAALASAGAAFLANRDDGNQLKWLQQSSQTRAAANEAYAEGDQQLSLDQTIFIEFATAYNNGEDGLAEYLSTLSPTLEEAIGIWVEDPDAVTPFTGEEPIYSPPGHAEGERLDAQADAEFARADFFDSRGDDFVRATVIFALALGLLGIGGVVARWSTKLLFTGGGAIALAAGITFTVVTL